MNVALCEGVDVEQGPAACWPFVMWIFHVQSTGQVVRGLPALCVSLAARGAVASWAAAALLPMAAAWESSRSASQPV